MTSLKKAAEPLCLFLLLTAAYLPVLVAKRTAGPDADMILNSFLHLPDLAAYLKGLLNLTLLDVQPLRDLTLYIDWKIFQATGLNSFVLQNFLWWFIDCLLFKRLLATVFPGAPRKQHFYLSLAFAIYPLFSAAVPWNMARKHVQSLAFMLLATLSILKRAPLKATLFYSFSVFTHPIAILWPFWALGHELLLKRAELRRFLPRLIPCLLVMGLAVALNSRYYTTSATFLATFEARTNTIDPADIILATGHYFFQLVFPYKLAFYYSLGDWYVWAGLVLLILFLLCLKRVFNRHVASWLVLAACPLAVVLVKPQYVYDTYITIPTLVVFLAIGFFLERYPFPKPKWVLPPLFLFWVSFTAHEAWLWTDINRFTYDRNFQRRPNCPSATRAARRFFASSGQVPSDVINFLNTENCLGAATNYHVLDSLILKAHYVYYDQATPLEKRLEVLANLGQVNYLVKLLQVGLMLEHQVPGADGELQKLQDQLKAPVPYTEHDRVITQVIWPHCQRSQNHSCLTFLAPAVVGRHLPYF